MRSILQVVERQCRQWELQEETRRKRIGAGDVEHWPVIVVSREFGARGEMLARTIGARIGFAVWDGRLVHAIAEESGADERVLRSLDEHRRRIIEDTIEGGLLGGAYMHSEYLRRLMKLFHTIASHGKGVIVGRGAEYVLDAKETLRIRVVCNLEARVHDYAARHSLDEDRARKAIQEGEEERAAFIRQNYQRRMLDPSDYDLCLNTGTLELEASVGIVLDAYQAKFHRRPPPVEASAPAIL